MQELIETVNQLQEVFEVNGYKSIDLPQIVVVGTQSSGKSSVLENIVGRSFLPRGTGIVTRCPLVLQLSQSPSEEYATFQHNPTKVFREYDHIRQEIDKQTEALAGNNKGICSKPIILKLYSPSHLDLTLVDLPGLMKVPVGDQPPDIEEQTTKLIMDYVENPNSVILAVVPANADMATSESLKIAREVDPNGHRTLAVVTKLDLMDLGTTAYDMLNGKVIPVKLGIVGVVNRSQKDINDSKSVLHHLLDETEFFKNNYEDIAYLHGTPFLRKSVQRILINHIKTCLPKLKQNISQQLVRRQAELKVVGESKLDHPSQMLELLTKFCDLYRSLIKGNISNIETTELCGGARIKNIFQQTLFNFLKSIDGLSDISKDNILSTMKNSTGISPGLFVPEDAFQLLAKHQIKKLRGPSQECVNLIHDELNKIRKTCLQDKELGLLNYPKLQSEVSNVVMDLLSERVPVTRDMIANIIDVQLAYINTSHPDFIPNLIPIEEEKETTNETKPRSSFKILSDIKRFYSNLCEGKEDADYVLIQELIHSYFSIVKESIQDLVPKVIVHFFVNYVMEKMHNRLLLKLFDRKDIATLLHEPPEVVAKREGLVKIIAKLEKANKILNSFSPVQEFDKNCSEE